MRIRDVLVAAAWAFASVTAVADRPVAMLVETAARGLIGEETVVAITVQVAPEDRQRLGRDVWIQAELMRGRDRVDRLARPADLDADGRATIEVAWPAGNYRLNVEIEGAGKRVSGIWTGSITVPGDAAPAAPAPVPTDPVSAPEIPEPEALALEPSAAADVGEQPPAADDETPATAVAAAAAPVVLAGASEGTPPSPMPETPAPRPSVSAEVDEQPPATDDQPPPGAAAVATTPAVRAGSSEVPPPTPASDTPALETSALQLPEATEAGDEPPSTGDGPAVSPPSSPRPPSPASPASTWPPRDGGRDLTVMVTDRNRPVLGLGAGSFGLRIGGDPVAIAAVGNASSAPLNLALAVSTPEIADERADVENSIARFAHRTAGVSGSILLTAPGSSAPRWQADVAALIATFDTFDAAVDPNLADLIASAVAAFENRAGRSALVMVTDGRDGASRADWRGASAVAETAGIPIFVIGLRDTGFPSKTRSTLGQIADSSGGRSYFLGDPSMLQMTLDYVGELVNASYALHFEDPSPGSGAVRGVKLEVEAKGWKVHAPEKIR